MVFLIISWIVAIIVFAGIATWTCRVMDFGFQRNCVFVAALGFIGGVALGILVLGGAIVLSSYLVGHSPF